MTAHDWYVENRVAFAAKTLDAKDAESFANHLSRCEECRVAVAQIETELAWLPMGVTPVAPRPGLTHSFMEKVLHQRRVRGWPRVASVAAAASLLLVLGAWTEARREVRALATRLQARQGELSALQDTLSAIVGAERVLQERITGPGYEGGVLIFYDHDTERWNVVVHDLPPAPSGHSYQLWFLSSRGLRPGPELHMNGVRPTFVAVPAPTPSSDVVGAVLTLGSSAGPSPGVELARLTF